MFISYIKNKKGNENSILLHNDGSFCAHNVYYDFQIFLKENRSLILNFDLYSKICVSCEGFLVNKKIKKSEIKIDNYIDGALVINLLTETLDLPYFEYFLDENLSYDEINNKICFGKIGEEIIKFGNGQYASFSNNKLVGIILELTSKTYQ